MTTFTSTAYKPTIGQTQPGSPYYYYPPDNALAVGPTNGAGQASIVMAENASIEWGVTGSTATLTGVTQKTLTSFFSPLSPYGQIFDPRVLYDSTNGRFVVVAAETNSTLSRSTLLIAVSKDGNPADGWYFQAVNSAVQVSKSTTWADYPTVAVDGSRIIISTNQFTPAGAYRGSYQFALGDRSGVNGGLYAGGTSSVTTTAWGSAYASVQEVSAPGAHGSYGVSYVGNKLSVAFTSTAGATKSYSVSLGSIDAGGRAGYAAAQPGSTWKLDAGDGRVTSAVYANGKLFAAFEVNTGTTSAPKPTVHWVELDATKLGTAGAVVAQGNITMAGAVTFNPSIAVDGNGDAIINFTASGTSLYATDYFAVMPSGQTSFSVPVAYQSSASTAYAQGSGGVSRWGDYSSAVADPSNPGGVWLSNEYVVGATTWGTVLDKVTLGIPSSTSLTFLAPTGTVAVVGKPGSVAAMEPEGDVPAGTLASLADLVHGVALNDLVPGGLGGFRDAAAHGLSDPTASAGVAAGTWAVPGDHGSIAWHKIGQA